MARIFACTRRLVVVGVLALSVAGLANCSGTDGPTTHPAPPASAPALNPTTSVCEFDDVLPSPARLVDDPCQSGSAVSSDELGPPNFGVGHAESTFTLDANSHVCVTVDAGTHSSQLAQPIIVDGQIVWARHHQESTAPGRAYIVDLGAGAHIVEVVGETSSPVNVDVHTTDMDPGQATVVGQNGILRTSNVAADHSLFSPNNDGFHDDTKFFADNLTWYLPGQQSGRFDYELDWEFEVFDVDSCQSIGIVSSGRTPAGATTNVVGLWDGTDPAAVASADSHATDQLAPNGQYLYIYRANLMRSDGMWLDSVQSHPHGFIMDTTSSPQPTPTGPAVFNASAMTNPNQLTSCDPAVDPDECHCPTGNLPPNSRCTDSLISNLETFDNLANVSRWEFVDPSYDAATDRFSVTVDLRSYNGGGLVPQTDGTWTSISELQAYIQTLTGIPKDPNDERLFNFDYIQYGDSTPVVSNGAVTGFDHFLLDVITDVNGELHIGSATYDLAALFADGNTNIPSVYQFSGDRDGDECYINANTNGKELVQARSCTRLRMANIDPGGTDLGIYRIQTRAFNITEGGRGTDRESYCTSSGKGCGVRTIQRDADIEFTRDLYTQTGTLLTNVGSPVDSTDWAPALVVESDRYFDNGSTNDPIDGVCMQDGTVLRRGVPVHIATADGALPSTCIINGIAF